MMENVTIDRNTMIRVNVPGTSGFYRLRCEAFFTVSKADFKKMMKALKADAETAADNARIVSEWAFQNREAVKASGSMERWAAVNSIFSDYQERPESAVISSAVSDLEKLNKKMKTGRKVTKEIRGADLYFTNNLIVLKHGNAAMYEDWGGCVETSNTYNRIFSGFENKSFLFSQVLPDAKTLKIQGKTRGAKQTAYYVNAKGTAFNVNYIQYAAAVTDSRDIYFTSDGNVCYMAGNGFTVAIAQCAIDFSDCANNIIITESRNTLAGMEVIYKYPCGDSLPVYRCVMEYFNGDHNTTYHPTREAAFNYAEEIEKHYPGIVAGISVNSGTIAGHMSWNNDAETIQAASIEAEAKENNKSTPAGKESANYAAGAIVSNVSNVSNVSDASDASDASENTVIPAADIPADNVGIDLSRLNALFLNNYEMLYNTRAYDYDAVKRFDKGLSRLEIGILKAFNAFRNDFITSDRECTAFVYALDEIQKETAAVTPEKLETIPEGMPETAPAVIPTKTSENGAEGNDGISYKASGKTSVYQPKTGITGGIEKYTDSRPAENAIPAGIEKMSICTNSTKYSIITNYHNMPILPVMPAMYRNDNMRNSHKLHNSVGTGFPSAPFCAPSAAFCGGKYAFCDIPSGVPPGTIKRWESSRWNHPCSA